MQTNTKKITIINVENIPCYCSIGIHSEEKKMGQNLIIDVRLKIASSLAVSTDSIENTLSYVDVYNVVQEVGKSRSYSLIEVLGEEIAETLLKHPLVLEAKIKVHKPHIPFPNFRGDVSIEVERTK